jgi:hypothetical protein
MGASKEPLEEVGAVTDMEVYSIGDWGAPRRLFVALHEGYKAGVKV